MDKSAESYVIDDQDAGLFRVNRRAFTDPECLADERRRVFDKCWIYVGHESEVPHAGDYRSRNVAGRPMILVRGDDSVVRVLLTVSGVEPGARLKPVYLDEAAALRPDVAGGRALLAWSDCAGLRISTATTTAPCPALPSSASA